MAHGGRSDDADIRRIREALEDPRRLGPTDAFPEGKLSESDDGELRISIGVEKGKVVMHFGEPTMWIGFTPEQAAEIGALLIQKARATAKSPLTVRL